MNLNIIFKNAILRFEATASDLLAMKANSGKT